MKYLFIAEKKSLMDTVEATYKKHRADINARIGEIDFIELSGHVCRYLDPDEYPQWKGLKWAETDLPMIPEPFKITSIDNPPYKKKYFDRVKQMIKNNRYDGIIVATDSDVEGNGIYYLLCETLGLHHYDTLRFFERSLTDKEILDSLYHMTDFYQNPRDVQMTESYLVRSHADWMIGMNATRALTVKTGEILRVGRVKAPTLKLVYDNSKAIDEFVPHSDYLVKAVYFEGFTGTYQDENGPVAYATKQEAEDFIKSLGNPLEAAIISLERKRAEQRAPKLYKLSTIQAEAGSAFNYDPQKTLDIIQSLYEKHKLVSYPRTDGEYVSSEKAKEFPALLRAASHIPSLSGFIGQISQADITKAQANKNVVNDAEVQKASHDALLPTEKIPDISKLTQEEINIYDMICRRLTAQFLPNLAEEKTVLLADIEGYTFKSNGTSVIDKGWTVLYNRQSKGETIPAELNKGDYLGIEELQAYEKKSTPPKRLTTASLVSAMENIAKYINDKKLKQTMTEAKGLGQPSTRGVIIEELITTGYMEKKTKANQLFITDMGKRYIETVLKFTISDPVQTAEWEGLFQGVKEGTVSYIDAENQFKHYVQDFVKEVGTMTVQRVQRSSKNAVQGVQCPWCGKPVIKFNWGYACEDSQKGCGFKVSGFDGKLKESDLKKLVTNGVTREIKGVAKSSKTNKPFDAKIKLNPKGSQYVTSFEFTKK